MISPTIKNYNYYSKFRPLALNLLLVLVVVLLLFSASELAIRVFYLQKYNQPIFENPRNSSSGALVLDNYLGWRANESYKFKGDRLSKDGTKYPVDVSFLKDGFRAYSESANKNNKRLLFIGDSYTQALEVSNNKTYYHLIGSELGVQIYSYGVGGYGSLQESMLLEQILTQVNPTLLIWQLSSNDIINNDSLLEGKSTINNNRMLRPFLVNSQVEYHITTSNTFLNFNGLPGYSLLAFVFIHQLDRFRAINTAEQSVEFEINRTGFSHPDLIRSVQTTKNIFKQAFLNLKDIPILSFVAREPQDVVLATAIRNCALESGFTFVDGVSEAIFSNDNGRGSHFHINGHWNELGHQLVAKILVNSIKKNLN